MPTATHKKAIPILTWENCYSEQWGTDITPISYSHPAKARKALLRRIIEHGFERGYFKPGDTVLDPFGGIGTTGIMCSYADLNSISVELEPKFCRMATGYDCPGLTKEEWEKWRGRFDQNPDLCPQCQAEADKWTWDGDLFALHGPHHLTGNLELHRPAWLKLGHPLPLFLQGDSRRLVEIVGQVQAALTSPPWQDQEPSHAQKDSPSKQRLLYGSIYVTPAKPGCLDSEYGRTPGQVGRLPAGSVDSVLTSPTYGEGLGHGDGRADCLMYAEKGLAGQAVHQYGTDPHNLGNLPCGSVDSVVTSPPYAESVHDGNAIDRNKLTGNPPGPHSQVGAQGYGHKNGNLGNLAEGKLDAIIDPTTDAQGETLWLNVKTAEPQLDANPVGAKNATAFTTGDRESPRQKNTKRKSRQPITEFLTPCNTPRNTLTGKAARSAGEDMPGESKDAKPWSATATNAQIAAEPQESPSTISDRQTKPAEDGTIPSTIFSACAGHVIVNDGGSTTMTSSARCVAKRTSRKIRPPALVPDSAERNSERRTTTAGKINEQDISISAKYVERHSPRDRGESLTVPALVPSSLDDRESTTKIDTPCYWSEVAKIYTQVRQVLKPQGVMVIILKSYIKHGKIVDLPADTLKLLTHLGFEPLEIVRAMLVEEHHQDTLFEGKITKTKSKKSFFRRLCEAKGSPSIDYEVVLFVRKGAA